MDINLILERCRQDDRLAQHTLYQQYAPVMLGICRRYIEQLEDAEDVMIEGFFKVFNNLEKFDSRGSFEGWMKRIMINESLMWLRKRKLKLTELQDNLFIAMEEDDLNAIELNSSEIIPLLDLLPAGYRTVFNLYVIEEYKHREIADMLHISINTSKSQLILAKKKPKEIIELKKINPTFNSQKSHE